jgi:membrane protease YdiL (CAAX protease family)
LYLADVYHDKVTKLRNNRGLQSGFDMSNQLKIRSPLSQLALFMGLLGAALILLVFVAGAIYHATGYTEAVAGDPGMIRIQKLIQALSTIIVFGIPAYFYAKLSFGDRPLYELGLRAAVKNSFYPVVIVLLLVAFPLEGWLGELNKQFPLPTWVGQMEKINDRQFAVFLKAGTTFEVIINLVVIAALPAFFEELCFRGALQRILIDVFKNPWTGIVCTGIFFSCIHMQFEGFLPRLFLGILLGAGYWYSGSLWTPILAHFFYNGIQVVAVMLYPAMLNGNSAIPPYTVLISMVIVVGLLYWMKRNSNGAKSLYI